MHTCPRTCLPVHLFPPPPSNPPALSSDSFVAPPHSLWPYACITGILGPDTYSNLSQCETLDDLKMNLQTNEGYAGFLQNEPSPTSTMPVTTDAVSGCAL